jgi:hypothetical protein
LNRYCPTGRDWVFRNFEASVILRLEKPTRKCDPEDAVKTSAIFDEIVRHNDLKLDFNKKKGLELDSNKKISRVRHNDLKLDFNQKKRS